MLAVAIQIPEFPANVRSDTYQIDYGRTLGVEWMERSAGWNEANAPMVGDPWDAKPEATADVIEVTYTMVVRVTRESWTSIIGEAPFDREQVVDYLERSLQAEAEYGVASEVDITEM